MTFYFQLNSMSIFNIFISSIFHRTSESGISKVFPQCALLPFLNWSSGARETECTLHAPPPTTHHLDPTIPRPPKTHALCLSVIAAGAEQNYFFIGRCKLLRDSL